VGVRREKENSLRRVAGDCLFSEERGGRGRTPLSFKEEAPSLDALTFL